MRVRIKRIDKDLPLPVYETNGSVGFDFISREKTIFSPQSVARVPSNVVVETPKGYMLLVKDRSSTAMKKGLLITSGVIDNDYCGENDEIQVQMYNPSDKEIVIERGDRVAQGIFVRVDKVEWEEVDTMNNKSRGGFGTTG